MTFTKKYGYSNWALLTLRHLIARFKRLPLADPETMAKWNDKIVELMKRHIPEPKKFFNVEGDLQDVIYRDILMKSLLNVLRTHLGSSIFLDELPVSLDESVLGGNYALYFYLATTVKAGLWGTEDELYAFLRSDLVRGNYSFEENEANIEGLFADWDS